VETDIRRKMPIFDFECKKCGTVVAEICKWSEDMHEHIDKCEDCGELDFKRIITVSWAYTRDLTGRDGKEMREAEKLIQK
jgi:putative FmdB family regulatory protein